MLFRPLGPATLDVEFELADRFSRPPGGGAPGFRLRDPRFETERRAGTDDADAAGAPGAVFREGCRVMAVLPRRPHGGGGWGHVAAHGMRLQHVHPENEATGGMHPEGLSRVPAAFEDVGTTHRVEGERPSRSPLRRENRARRCLFGPSRTNGLTGRGRGTRIVRR